MCVLYSCHQPACINSVDSNKWPGGAIAAAVILGSVALLAIIVVIIMVWQNRQLRQEIVALKSTQKLANAPANITGRNVVDGAGLDNDAAVVDEDNRYVPLTLHNATENEYDKIMTKNLIAQLS